MTDRAQLAALGAQTSGGDWPADLDTSLRCGTLGAHVEQPAIFAGDYIAPIGDDLTTPGPVGYCLEADSFGLRSIRWFDRYGDFTHSHLVAIGSIPKGYQRIPGSRPLAPRPLDPQPAPIPGTGDVWREIIDAEPLAVLRKLYEARRLVGIKNYGVPLQRGNERDTARDLEEELLDALAYATALEWWGVATVIRVVLLCVVTRRRGGS